MALVVVEEGEMVARLMMYWEPGRLKSIAVESTGVRMKEKRQLLRNLVCCSAPRLRVGLFPPLCQWAILR
jgi:hypothetical protein